MKIAYLAPEVPALSATFVYEELLELEKFGYLVIPISVHKPAYPVKDLSKLSCRTFYLYNSSKVGLVINGFFGVFRFKGFFKALSWLLSDLISSNPFKLKTWKLTFQFLTAVKVAIILRKYHCKHLHIHFAHVPSQIGMYASAMTGIPFTIMAHANDIFERGMLLKKKSERAKKFLTISDYNKNHLLSIGISPKKIDIVRCGVSFPIKENKRVILKTFFIGTLGRLVEKKGFDVLIKAVGELNNEGYHLKLSIVGDGPLKDDLGTLVDKLSLEGVVNFLGSMNHNDVSSWLKNLNAFVLACKQDKNGDQDGIPVVLMEAMSQSIPVITTRISGIPELVIDNQTGLLAEPGDIESLKISIKELVNNNSLGDKLVKSAKNHVKEEFGQKTNIERLIKHFESNP